MTKMLICQSCEMPLTEEKLFGTNRDGSKNEDYCIYCFENGEFHTDETMEEMIESCIKPCLEHGVYPDAGTARAAMLESFPKLKRWQKANCTE